MILYSFYCYGFMFFFIVVILCSSCSQCYYVLCSSFTSLILYALCHQKATILSLDALVHVVGSQCLLFSPLLKPCCAFKIHLLKLAQFFSQAYSNVLVKFITHLPCNCQSVGCSKLYSIVTFHNFLNCLVCCSPHICCSFQSLVFPLLLPSLFELFYNCLIHGFFP